MPGKSQGRRSLVGCLPWGREESDMTERLHYHFSLSRIGEGNGNPLQCSCLENPRDGEAWWAAVYGVAQSQTRLKQLSSSSSSSSSMIQARLIRKVFLKSCIVSWSLLQEEGFKQVLLSCQKTHEAPGCCQGAPFPQSRALGRETASQGTRRSFPSLSAGLIEEEGKPGVLKSCICLA